MASPRAERTALGFSPHIGWAAVVAVAGRPRAGPRVVAKARMDLATTFETGAVYHAAQGRSLGEAEALVRSSEETFLALACDQIAALAAALGAQGLAPAAAVVLAGSGRPLPPLEQLLRSHALVHAAEGALYRRVLERACDACGIPAEPTPATDLAARVAAAAQVGEAEVRATLARLGKATGRPWGRDQKDAALAGWLALARTRRRAPSAR